MKVLWLSNVSIANSTMVGSGTWVMSMARALCENYDDIEIYNISMSSIESTESCRNNQITQININSSTLSESFISRVNDYIDEICPKIIHIWGTESLWCKFPFKKNGVPILVDMQGVVSSVYDNFYGGLGLKTLAKCIGLKEILKPSSSLPFCRKLYKSISRDEYQILSSLKHVSVQSEWVEGHIKALNPSCKVYRTAIGLRPEFYTCSKWHLKNDYVIFSTATMVSPLKGLHLLLKSLNIVKKYFPNVQLRLAGSVQLGIKKGGYAKLLFNYIKENNLEENILFLGELNTLDLIAEYQKAAVFVNPSYIESYSLVVAEAMHIGVPTVASFVGGMSELGINNKSILYFPKDDYVTCAHQILRILTNPNFSKSISMQAVELSEKRNSYSYISAKQMEIYVALLQELS